MRTKFFIIIISCLMIHKIYANMMKDMAVMMGAQVGASAANQAVSSEFSDMQTALATDQSNISQAINNFSTAMQQAQKQQLTNVFHLFSNAQNNISNALTAQQSEMKSMDSYLQAAISRQQPQEQYLVNPTSYDEQFTQATMYTPQGVTWKNLFPVGNWEYDQNSDSFWQMSNVPVEQKAFNNSIFAEWVSRAASYEIVCNITLYQASYPFFVGIIFNKARWISGNESRLQKYRLFGLYGDQNQNIQLCFAEATQTTPATATSAAVWSYPFDQISSGTGVLKTKTLKNLLQNLKKYPILVHIKIKNSPTTIQYKFWTSTEKEPVKYETMKSKNPNLYLYHDVGFMAPGTISEFKLLQPSELLFSNAHQIMFKAQVQSLLQKELVKVFATNIDALVGAKL
ncbi:hypothetical protein KBB68_02710 [Candidatus Babeliales bacterium]|nr:hypothetical protein [Candidatus Babeliales bacterium]